MTVRDILSSAFSYLFEMEAEMNALCDKMADASPEELEQYMEELVSVSGLTSVSIA